MKKEFVALLAILAHRSRQCGHDPVFTIRKPRSKQRFSLGIGNTVVPMVYRHGLLSEDTRDHMVRGEKAKYYYQKNMATQGIDIRLGHRAIATAQFDQIWHTKGGKCVIMRIKIGLFYPE